jgi:hypothetical protein
MGIIVNTVNPRVWVSLVKQTTTPPSKPLARVWENLHTACGRAAVPDESR